MSGGEDLRGRGDSQNQGSQGHAEIKIQLSDIKEWEVEESDCPISGSLLPVFIPLPPVFSSSALSHILLFSCSLLNLMVPSSSSSSSQFCPCDLGRSCVLYYCTLPWGSILSSDLCSFHIVCASWKKKKGADTVQSHTYIYSSMLETPHMHTSPNNSI